MTLRLGVFVAPDASHPETTVEVILAADRAGLDLVGVQDHPYQRRFFDTWTLLAYATARGSPSGTAPRCRWSSASTTAA